MVETSWWSTSRSRSADWSLVLYTIFILNGKKKLNDKVFENNLIKVKIYDVWVTFNDCELFNCIYFLYRAWWSYNKLAKRCDWSYDLTRCLIVSIFLWFVISNPVFLKVCSAEPWASMKTRQVFRKKMWKSIDPISWTEKRRWVFLFFFWAQFEFIRTIDWQRDEDLVAY